MEGGHQPHGAGPNVVVKIGGLAMPVNDLAGTGKTAADLR